MHACGEKIPSDIDLNGLLEVTVICEDYNCAAAMLPWCKKSIDEWHLGRPVSEGWLYIAWIFRFNDVFRNLTRDMAKGIITGDGVRKVIANEGVQELGKYIPSRVIGNITMRKFERIGNVVQPRTLAVLLSYATTSYLGGYIVGSRAHRCSRTKLLISQTPPRLHPQRGILLKCWGASRQVSGLLKSLASATLHAVLILIRWLRWFRLLLTTSSHSIWPCLSEENQSFQLSGHGF
ncbi:hypothetical protein K440DRAFT_231160 [Wilcoxina mikolae CBS 423.85]|nr:hypothetical protein K440DRAFT_231160 [Wilcoxina mikolae CBS 423.85]